MRKVILEVGEVGENLVILDDVWELCNSRRSWLRMNNSQKKFIRDLHSNSRELHDSRREKAQFSLTQLYHWNPKYGQMPKTPKNGEREKQNIVQKRVSILGTWSLFFFWFLIFSILIEFMQRRSIHSAQMSHAAVGKPSTITAKNYPFDAIVKHGVFVEKICKYTPPLSLGRTFSRLFSLQSQSTCFWVRYPPPSCFDGQIFYWTIGIWPMTCLPVVNLEIPPYKSQSKISTDQSVHSSCPLHGAMRSLCLPKGLEFGFANWKISTVCHYSISGWILVHTLERTFGTASTLGYVVKEAMTLQSRCYFGLQNVRHFFRCFSIL